jgi:hypothetical protein
VLRVSTESTGEQYIAATVHEMSFRNLPARFARIRQVSAGKVDRDAEEMLM